MSGYDFSQEVANEMLEKADKRNDEFEKELAALRVQLQQETKDKDYILFLLQQIANMASDGDDPDWNKIKEENEKRGIKENDWLQY